MKRRVPDDVDLPCPHCGYNLRGLVREGGYHSMETGARCPECGHESDLWSMYRARYRTRIFFEDLLLQLLVILWLILPAILLIALRMTDVFSIMQSAAAFWLGVGVCLVHAVVASRIIGKRLDFAEMGGASPSGRVGLFMATAIGVVAANLTLMIAVI